MAYRKTNPISTFWRRKKIERGIKRYHLDPTATNKRKVINLLAKGLFHIAVRELPEIPTDKNGRITKDIPIKYLMGTGPEGRVLFCFTSKRHLRLTNKTAGSIILNLSGVFRYRTDDLAGLVINPKSEGVFISWSDLEDIIPSVDNNPL